MNWKQLRKIRLIDLITPSRWRSFSISMMKKYLESQGEIPEYSASSIEQIHYRLLVKGCQPCVESGSCEHCGCMIPDRMFVLSDYCSGGHWGKFLSEEEWEKYKVTNKVVFSMTETN